jgi:protocatechuate 3,4-dioxygenase beta subunit
LDTFVEGLKKDRKNYSQSIGEIKMRNLSEAKITDAVLAAMENTQDARLKEVMSSLIRHLHAFIREVQPSEAEWMAGIQFLTAAGQMCSPDRQEFILLSDTLGVTALKDTLNQRRTEAVTEATVLGPFYRDGAPDVPLMADISGGIEGEPVVVSGKVTDPQGNPIPNALLDIWQATGDGFYDVQLDSLEGQMGLRGKIRTDADGGYIFRSIKPSSYPIPHDGPVGKMLQALGRHPYRPAHIHFILSAEGYQPVTTQIFVAGDAYLDSDAVFGVKDSLVVDFVKNDSPEEAAQYGFQPPFYQVQYDFVLKKLSAVSDQLSV